MRGATIDQNCSLHCHDFFTPLAVGWGLMSPHPSSGATVTMRFFRRRLNPIFIEDEEPYDWGRQHSVGPKVLFIVITFSTVMSVLYFFLQ